MNNLSTEEKSELNTWLSHFEVMPDFETFDEKKWHDEVIIEWNTLEKLHITGKIEHSNNPIEFPEALSKIKTLKQISIARIILKSFPKFILKLENLMHIHLDNLQIENFPKELCSLSKLKKLILKNNKITEIPINIKDMKNLDRLGLSGNNISNFPNVYKLPSISRIFLENNKITSISNEITNISPKTLITIVLSGNPINNIDEKTFSFLNYERLYCRKNEYGSKLK